MSMRSSRAQAIAFALAAGLLVLSIAAQAKNKKAKAAPKDPQDKIEVFGRIPSINGPVRRFLTTQHYSSYYLYAEHDAGRGVTLIDVTNIAKPSILTEVSYPSGGGASGIFAVAGTSALLVEQHGATAPPPAPQTIRIMDFADPQRPSVAREFTGVTAIGRDDPRGLIFLANPDGIWILHQNLAEDPEVEKAYAHHVLYDH